MPDPRTPDAEPRRRRRAVGPAGAVPPGEEPRPEPSEEDPADVDRFLRDRPPHHDPKDD